MRVEETFHRSSVLRAIERWHAGTLGELETHRLKDLLREDPAARQLFVEFGDMLATLDFAVGSDLPAGGNLFAQRAFDTDRGEWTTAQKWSLGALLLASALCLVLVPSLLLTGKLALQAGGQTAAAEAPVAVIKQFFTIASENTENAREPDVEADIQLNVGRRFLPGEELRIPFAGQFIGLVLERGVELLVQGPAHLLFEPGNSVRLQQGQLVGTVPPAGTGFTVNLPHGQVRDLGTIFSVSVRQSDSSVTVLSGRVECRLSRPDQSLLEPVLIQSGESARLDPERATPLLLAEVEESLATVIGVHSGVLQFTDDVHFSPNPAPTPRERRNFESGKIIVFPEARQIALTWDSTNRSFSHADSAKFSDENVLLTQSSPEHLSPLLSDLQEGHESHVDSYLLSMSPTGKGTMILEGTVTFQGEILAVYTSRDGLVATDHFSLNPEFAESWKDHSPGARGSRENNDEVSIEEDRHTLKVTLQASGAGDQLRVLVRSNPGKQ